MGKKILAVDDSASMRQMVLMTLKGAGVGITLVRELRALLQLLATVARVL
jgi:CheY-like chemotaxis protein